MEDGYKKIFFDFDSTVVQTESLDLLAREKGCGDEVERITSMTMNGLAPVSDLFRKKMKIISPFREDVVNLADRCRTMLVDGISDIIDSLHKLGKDVYILSAGFRDIIKPTADLLNIPYDNILANDMIFDHKNKYIGFDNTLGIDLTENKHKAIEKVLSYEGVHPEKSVMIGDSVQDMKCQSVVGLFIGFGGVSEREKVKENSKIYIYNIKDALNYII